MADNDGLGLQPTVGSYSQLLFAADDAGLENGDCYNYKSYFSSSDQCTPKMLCFGDYRNACEFSNTVSETTQTTVQKSGVTCSNSSSTSTANKSTGRANRKRNWPGSELALQGSTAGGGAPAGGQRNSKMSKSETLTSTGNGKKQGKREKLGDRIAALQQLVSPYGKTDTASVLHEAMGYIRFLHEQVQVLCSPYLQRLPSSSSNLLHSHVKSENEQESEEARNELRSRGLCLVPIELTEHIANDNGADFWSPAAMANPNFFPPKH